MGSEEINPSYSAVASFSISAPSSRDLENLQIAIISIFFTSQAELSDPSEIIKAVFGPFSRLNFVRQIKDG